MVQAGELVDATSLRDEYAVFARPTDYDASRGEWVDPFAVRLLVDHKRPSHRVFQAGRFFVLHGGGRQVYAGDSASEAVRAMLGRKDNGASMRRPASSNARRPMPNTVYFDVHDFSHRRLGVLAEPHDGTRRGMKSAAATLQARAFDELGDHTQAGSRLFVTDAAGELALTLSPNLLIFEPVPPRTRPADSVTYRVGGVNTGRKPFV